MTVNSLIRATQFPVEVSIPKFDGVRQYPAKKWRGKERDLAVIKVDEYAIPEFVCALNMRTSRHFHLGILPNHKNLRRPDTEQNGGLLRVKSFNAMPRIQDRRRQTQHR